MKGEGFAVDASVVAADASRQQRLGKDGMQWRDRSHCSRAVREYLEALDTGSEDQAVPRNVSFTDPQARWTAAPGGPALYAYSTNHLIDTEHAVIMDVEATTAHRTAEVEVTKTMIASRCVVNGASSRRHGHTSRRPPRLSTGRPSRTARSAQ